jgi:hypothetical protein
MAERINWDAFDLPEYRSEDQVWIHLENALDSAEDILSYLRPQDRVIAQAIAKHVADARIRMVGDPQHADFFQLADELLENEWFKHAADVVVARSAVARAENACDRFVELKPILTRFSIPERARPYLSETTELFLLGFDAGCIAFCGASLEQILKDVLIEHRVFTEAQIRRDQTPARTLIREARPWLQDNALNAELVFEERNRIMHKHLWDDRVIRGMAMKTLERFASVVAELGTRLA